MGRMRYMHRRVESLERMLRLQQERVAYFSTFEDTPLSMSTAEGLRKLFARRFGRLTWDAGEVRAWVRNMSEDDLSALRGFGPRRAEVARKWAGVI